MASKKLEIGFRHGLGDCVHLVHLLQLYREAGYEFVIHGDSNKEWIWQVAGVEFRDGEGGARFEWGYPGNFEDPHAPDCHANKIGHNINQDPLPTIPGSKQELWDRLCGVRVDATPHIHEEIRDEARWFIKGLPHPIVALHSRGTTWTNRKDIPDAVCFEFIRAMIDRGWSVVILDWDARAPMVSHARCRSIIPTWCMIDQERQCALFDEIDLVVGIDSGPFHLTSLREVPTLGVFREILPWRCSLPNPNAVCLCRNEHSSAMNARSDRWNFWQYSRELEVRDLIDAADVMLKSESHAIDHILQTYDALCGEYLYWRVGHDSRPLTFKNGCVIGKGGGNAERDWKALRIDGKVHILIYGEHGLICDLILEDDGIFRGSWTRFECMPIELIPSNIVTGGVDEQMTQRAIDRYLQSRRTSKQ